MSPESALELVNASENTTYTLNAQFSGGQDQGAFLLLNGDGKRAVLKLSRNPMWLSQVTRATAATSHLKALNYPVPTYIMSGSTDTGTYWLQSELPGSVLVGPPTVEQVTDLMRLIDLQKGQAISDLQGQDWDWYIADVVFQGEDGMVRALMKFSTDTSALVADIEGLVVGLQNKVLPKTDLVHGDMNMGQVLFQGPAVSGVLDWDQAGYGDRTIDLVSLWYSLMDAPEPRDLVMKHLLEISDAESIKIYAAHKMLAIVAWHINKVGGEVIAVVTQARAALDLLHKL
ncbi:MAG TPA: aminoglycoside phosphotransferase family protein [Candidatus Saccharimonadia bacterium]|nr:aminoglycoside phosphotransferase family protein [Candidatus Saccharimonadia bacterium]